MLSANLTASFVETKTDGQHLYCAACCRFHDRDGFSFAQRRMPPGRRYCTRLAPLRRAELEADLSAPAEPELTAAAIIDGAARAGVTLSDPPAVPQFRNQAEREKRMAARGQVPLGDAASERRLQRRASRLPAASRRSGPGTRAASASAG